MFVVTQIRRSTRTLTPAVFAPDGTQSPVDASFTRIRWQLGPYGLLFDDRQLTVIDELSEQRESLAETMGGRCQDAVTSELVSGSCDLLTPFVFIDHAREVIVG